MIDLTLLASLIIPDLISRLVDEIARPHFSKLIVARAQQSTQMRLSREQRGALERLVSAESTWRLLLDFDVDDQAELASAVERAAGTSPAGAASFAAALQAELDASLDPETARAVASGRARHTGEEVAELAKAGRARTADQLALLTRWSRDFERQLDELVEFGAAGGGASLYVRRTVQAGIVDRLDTDGSIEVVTGEAGSGKSSLLLGVARALDREDGRLPLLVSAAWFLELAGAGAPTANDVAEVVESLAAGGVATAVLLDTADLLLHRATLQSSLRILADRVAAAGGSFVCTSRPAEARATLAADFGFRSSLDRYDSRELRDAVESLAVRFCPGAHPDNPTAHVTDAIARGLPAQEICESPLLLRMLFELSSPAFPGLLDIDVTTLFARYWAHRVIDDIRDGSASAGAGDLSGLAMTIGIVGLALGTPEPTMHGVRGSLESGVPVIPGARMDPDLALLRSRGVLLGDDRTVRFFHQTMFEYASARAVLVRGGFAEISRLSDRLLLYPHDLFLGAVVEQLLILVGEGAVHPPQLAQSLVDLLQDPDSALQAIALVAVAHAPSVLPRDDGVLAGVSDVAWVRFLRTLPSIARLDLSALRWMLDHIWDADDTKQRRHVVEALARLAHSDPSQVAMIVEAYDPLDFIISRVPDALKNPIRLLDLLFAIAQSDPVRARESLLALAGQIRTISVEHSIRLLDGISDRWEELGDPEFGRALIALHGGEQIRDAGYRDLRHALGRIRSRVWESEAVDLVGEARRVSGDLVDDPTDVDSAITLCALGTSIVRGTLSEGEVEAVFDAILSTPGRNALPRVPGHFLLTLVRSGWVIGQADELERLAALLDGLPAPASAFETDGQYWAAAARVALADEGIDPRHLAAVIERWAGADHIENWIRKDRLLSLVASAAVGGSVGARRALTVITEKPTELLADESGSFLALGRRHLDREEVADAAVAVAISNRSLAELKIIVDDGRAVSSVARRVDRIRDLAESASRSPNTHLQEQGALLFGSLASARLIVADAATLDDLLASVSTSRARQHVVAAMVYSADPVGTLASLAVLADWEGRDLRSRRGRQPLAPPLLEQIGRTVLFLLGRHGGPGDWSTVLMLTTRARSVGHTLTIDGVSDASRLLGVIGESAPDVASQHFVELVTRLRDIGLSDKQLRDSANKLNVALNIIVRNLRGDAAAALLTAAEGFPITFAKFTVHTVSHFHSVVARPVLEALAASSNVELATHVHENLRGAARDGGLAFPELLLERPGAGQP